MTTAQKIIKNLAIAFAIFLIITIISTILGTLYALSGILGLKKQDENLNGQIITANFENNDITNIDIELAFTNLTIKTGDFIKIETNNNKINCKQENQKLEIEEKNDRLFSNNEEKDLVLYIPEEIEFEKVKINTGAGKIDVQSLNAKKLEFELGAGETEIRKLNVSKTCQIEGGAGKFSILSGTINDIDLDMGVGEINLTTNLIGRSEINAGIGNLNIDLQGEKESYKIQANKGIGSIKIDEKEVADGEIFGDGDNLIEIDGGIGKIDIKFK